MEKEKKREVALRKKLTGYGKIKVIDAYGFENAYIVESYPYGRLRTKAKYWIETTNRGQRIASQTLNPKTNKWNNPKKSTYSPVKALYLDLEDLTSEGNPKVKGTALSLWNKKEKIDLFIEDFEKVFSKYEQEQINMLLIMAKAERKYNTFKRKDHLSESPKSVVKPVNTQEQRRDKIRENLYPKLNKAMEEGRKVESALYGWGQITKLNPKSISLKLDNTKSTLKVDIWGIKNIANKPTIPKKDIYKYMTLGDLKKLAKEKGVKGYSNKKKDELIKLLL